VSHHRGGRGGRGEQQHQPSRSTHHRSFRVSEAWLAAFG
jgi:hypothetical protein